MASDWVKIFPALYYCDKEIGFICRTSVGGKLTSFLAKKIASSFLQAIGMNTRVSILESRLIWSPLLCPLIRNRRLPPNFRILELIKPAQRALILATFKLAITS